MKDFLARTFSQLGQRLLGEISSDLRGLVFPWHQSELVTLHRAVLIISRVRMTAGLFAVLTPLWIVLDIIYFPPGVWMMLAAGRIAVSAGFILLSLIYRKSDNILHAYIALGIMFLIPSLFFLYSHFIFLDLAHSYSGMTVSLITGYAFLPFVMAAGLSVFPLTALEGVAFATPALMVEIISGLYRHNLLIQGSNLGMVWLFVLIATVAILASMGQMHYLSEIILKASHDRLTGAFNRMAGLELLEKYYVIAKRNQSPLAVLLLDLDDFKTINDTWGHDAGDKVLRATSESIMHTTRQEDLLIRWGGEEFILVLPNALEDGCVTINKRLCRNGLGHRPDGAPITASMGLAELQKDAVSSLGELIATADERMYRAKKAGKNRLCYGDGPEDLSPKGIFGTGNVEFFPLKKGTVYA